MSKTKPVGSNGGKISILIQEESDQWLPKSTIKSVEKSHSKTKIWDKQLRMVMRKVW